MYMYDCEFNSKNGGTSKKGKEAAGLDLGARHEAEGSDRGLRMLGRALTVMWMLIDLWKASSPPHLPLEMQSLAHLLGACRSPLSQLSLTHTVTWLACEAALLVQVLVMVASGVTYCCARAAIRLQVIC